MTRKIRNNQEQNETTEDEFITVHGELSPDRLKLVYKMLADLYRQKLEEQLYEQENKNE